MIRIQLGNEMANSGEGGLTSRRWWSRGAISVEQRDLMLVDDSIDLRFKGGVIVKFNGGGGST